MKNPYYTWIKDKLEGDLNPSDAIKLMATSGAMVAVITERKKQYYVLYCLTDVSSDSTEKNKSRSQQVRQKINNLLSNGHRPVCIYHVLYDGTVDIRVTGKLMVRKDGKLGKNNEPRSAADICYCDWARFYGSGQIPLLNINALSKRIIYPDELDLPVHPVKKDWRKFLARKHSRVAAICKLGTKQYFPQYAGSPGKLYDCMRCYIADDEESLLIALNRSTLPTPIAVWKYDKTMKMPILAYAALRDEYPHDMTKLKFYTLKNTAYPSVICNYLLDLTDEYDERVLLGLAPEYITCG